MLYLSAQESRLLEITDAVRDPFALVCGADGTLPVFVRHLLQRWVEAVQVVNGWAGFAAQQVPNFEADPAVVVILDVT